MLSSAAGGRFRVSLRRGAQRGRPLAHPNPSRYRAFMYGCAKVSAMMEHEMGSGDAGAMRALIEKRRKARGEG